METIIMTKDHLSILRRVRRRSRLIHGIGILITLVLLVVPYVFKVQADLVTAAYRVAKLEFNGMLARQELLSILRSKPLSIGQALDVADVILGQKDVPVSMVLGIIQQESAFNAQAVSTKGARGLMQTRDLVFKHYSGSAVLQGKANMHDPSLNVRAGISYLADLKKRFGEWRPVLRAYAAGPDHANDKGLDWYVEGVISKASRYER